MLLQISIHKCIVAQDLQVLNRVLDGRHTRQRIIELDQRIFKVRWDGYIGQSVKARNIELWRIDVPERIDLVDGVDYACNGRIERSGIVLQT